MKHKEETPQEAFNRICGHPLPNSMGIKAEEEDLK